MSAADETKKIVNYVKEVLEVVKKQGADVESAENSLKGADAYIEQKNYAQATELCEVAYADAREADKKYAEKFLSDAKEMAEDVGRTCVEVKPAQDYLEKAEAFLNSGDYIKSRMLSLRAKQEAEISRETYDETFEAMSEAAALIGEARKFNVDITAPVEKLLAARSAFEKCEYDKANKYAKACRDDANKAMNRFKSAKKIIMATEKLAVVEKLKYDSTAMKNKLDEATTAIKAGDYAVAEELATLADSEAEGVLSNGLSVTVKYVEELVKEAKAGKLFDMSDAEESIARAKEALESRLYEEARNYLDNVRKTLFKSAEHLASNKDEKKKGSRID